ncbi:hypothetical protein [Rubritalea tangerina]
MKQDDEIVETSFLGGDGCSGCWWSEFLCDEYADTIGTWSVRMAS